MYLVFVELVNDRASILFLRDGNNYLMRFPKVIQIDSKFDYVAEAKKIEPLFEICRLIQKNISSRKSQEYIFNLYHTQNIYIYAGSGSAVTYRDNLYKRLCEAFTNLQWILESSANFNIEEFRIYERFYLDLKKSHGTLPFYLEQTYIKLKKVVDQINI